MFDLSKFKDMDYSNIDDLKNNKIDSEKINNIIDKVGKVVECDEECERKKKSDMYINNVLKLQREKDNNSEELKSAIKDYITNTKGEDVYNDYLFKKYTNETDIIVNKNLETLNKSYNELKDKINILNINNKSNEFVNFLIKDKIKDKTNLENTINNETYNILTNERRALYKSEQSEFIKKTKTFFIILYYILLFLYFVIEFILQKQYKNYKNWIYMLLYIVLPLIIVNFTFSISNLLINFYSSLKNNFKIEDI